MKDLSDRGAINLILRAIAQDDELIRQFSKVVGESKRVFSNWLDKVQVAEPLPKKVFVTCRLVEARKNGGLLPSQKEEFYAVHTTEDQAQRQVDKLTARFGPTFIITEAPLNP